MTGVAIGGGCAPPAGRWLPRTVAALFLGAGVYVGMAVATDVIAHADEPPAAATQAEQAPPEQAEPTDATTPADASPAADASGPAGDAPSMTTVSPSTTPTTADQATGTATSGSGETTGTGESATTTPTTTTASAATTTTTTATTSKNGPVTVATRDPSAGDTAEGPTQNLFVASATARPAGASDAVITQAQGALCEPSGPPGARDGGSADAHHPATAHSTGSLDHESETSAGGAGFAAAPADLITDSSTRTPDSAPFAPTAPLEVPAPATAFGLSGCGGPAAGQGSPKGASAPAAAGVLGAPLEVFPAVNDAAPTAPAAGSPTLTATDPATRPD